MAGVGLMCGRFSFVYNDWSEVISVFALHGDFPVYPKRYNVAPGQMVPAIISDGVNRRFGTLRWGLVPGFAATEKSGYKMINAKAETLTERPAFRRLLTRKRCLIPADGFFEWKKTDSDKQPMRVVLPSRKLFAFAGLYDTWTSADGNRIHTCTIITTSPNETMKTIHNRMPVILDREAEDIWLGRENVSVDVLLSLLKPYSAESMTVYPVSTLVNRVQNDSPDCILEVKDFA
jgi:putative SOS response-associated peptidase YedK